MATDAGRIYALDRLTGTDKTGYDFPVDLSPSTAVTSLLIGDEGKLYVGGANGRVYSLTE